MFPFRAYACHVLAFVLLVEDISTRKKCLLWNKAQFRGELTSGRFKVSNRSKYRTPRYRRECVRKTKMVE